MTADHLGWYCWHESLTLHFRLRKDDLCLLTYLVVGTKNYEVKNKKKICIFNRETPSLDTLRCRWISRYYKITELWLPLGSQVSSWLCRSAFWKSAIRCGNCAVWDRIEAKKGKVMDVAAKLEKKITPKWEKLLQIEVKRRRLGQIEAQGKTICIHGR